MTSTLNKKSTPKKKPATKKPKASQNYELGMVGLGVMGRNLLLNMADHGFSVAGYDTDIEKVEALRKESKKLDIKGAETVKEFISMLRKPRAIMLLVPAGAPVDAVIEELTPFLQKGDLIIDAGNSYYKDTDVRSQTLAKKGIHFFGVGVSGGEEGARYGPSIMPGGVKEVYDRISPILEAVAAKVNGEPCVAYLGPNSAGHFVKMVHNGIEYGLMQLIGEAYDLMKRGLGLSNDELNKVFSKWNKGELNGYLVEITANIFLKVDESTGKRLIDQILDVARQKGTGMWTSQSAMELQVPTPTIDLAVAMRDMSMLEIQRSRASQVLKRPILQFQGDRKIFIEQLGRALYSAMIITYAQGMALLRTASDKLKYHLDLETIARIWRGGCIIRAALLENIRTAYHKEPGLPNILLDPTISKKVMSTEEDMRSVVCTAAQLGIPAPGLMTALGYMDAYHNSWLPANLIQAQRDYFGSHTYERIDGKGTFHTQWDKEISND